MVQINVGAVIAAGPVAVGQEKSLVVLFVQGEVGFLVGANCGSGLVEFLGIRNVIPFYFDTKIFWSFFGGSQSEINFLGGWRKSVGNSSGVVGRINFASSF